MCDQQDSESADHVCKYREALEQIDRLDPEEFKTNQLHLSAAFREVRVRPLMMRICTIVNGALHNTDAEGNRLETAQ